MSWVSVLPPKGLLFFVDGVAVMQHRDVGDAGADLEQGDDLVLAGGGGAFQRGARGIRFDVHHGGRQAGRFGDRHAILDLFAARGGQHDFHVFRRIRHQADHVEVQAHFVERERDVLAGFRFDLHFQLVFGHAGRQDDLLGDDGGGRHAERDVAGAGAAFLPDAAHGLGHLVEVFDIAVDHGAARQRFEGMALEAQHALAGIGQLDQAQARRADVQAGERGARLSEQGT